MNLHIFPLPYENAFRVKSLFFLVFQSSEILLLVPDISNIYDVTNIGFSICQVNLN